MAPQEIKYIREVFGFTQEKLGRILCVASETVCRWESGAHSPRGIRLEILRAIHQAALRCAWSKEKSKEVADFLSNGIGQVVFLSLLDPSV